MKRIVKTAEELTFYEQVELIRGYCCLRDRLNASGGSEVAVTARTKLDEYGGLLNGRKLSLQMKG